MKTNHRRLIATVALAAVFSASAFAETVEKKEMRVLSNGDDDATVATPHTRRVIRQQHHEMESVAFLGVETRPVDPVLKETLDLSSGAGLVVMQVVPNAPAASVLKRYDVLVKLDDQLLIETRQLAVLVRNHKEGDEVTLTFLRHGKEMTSKVKLAKHDVPKFALNDGGNMFYMSPGMGFDREDTDRLLSLMDNGVAQVRRFNFAPQAPGFRRTTVNTENSNLSYSDEKGSLDLRIKDGKKELTAKNPKGDVVFSGPINTPEERKKMPAEVSSRLEQLEGMQEFSFKTDDDFEGGDVKVPAPSGTRLMIPRHAPHHPLAPGFF